MQQLYPFLKTFYPSRYTSPKAFLGFLLLVSFSCFSQPSYNAGQTSSGITTNGVNIPNLIAFTAQQENQKVIFNWTTSYEENLGTFTLQRSPDGKEFDDRTIIFSDGNTDTRRQYVFTDNIADLDNGINSGQIYYRLKLTSLDGKAAYSETIVLRFSNKGTRSLVTYPNPAVSTLRVILPEGWQNKTVSYNVYNSSGRLVLEKYGNSAEDSETVNIASLHIGIYLLRVATGNQAMTQSFIKAN